MDKNREIKFSEDECEAFIRGLGDREYFVQDRLVQHEEMSRLYPHSVNIIRIVTIKDREGYPQFFCVLLWIGVNGNVVDNWAEGEIVVSVNHEGLLGKEGFLRYRFIKR